MAIIGTGKTTFAPWGGPTQFFYDADFSKVEAEEVLGGAKPRRKQEIEAEIRRASREALLRRRKREDLEEQRRLALAGEANAKNVDQILKKVFTIDAELERIHADMIDHEIQVAQKKHKRRKRDKLAVLLLLH